MTKFRPLILNLLDVLCTHLFDVEVRDGTLERSIRETCGEERDTLLAEANESATEAHELREIVAAACAEIPKASYCFWCLGEYPSEEQDTFMHDPGCLLGRYLAKGGVKVPAEAPQDVTSNGTNQELN